MKTRIILGLVLSLFVFHATAQDQKAAIPVQKQLDAYNSRNIEAFLEPYSDSVKIYNHPDKLIMSGKTQMRSRYTGMFKQLTDLHCTLVNRMVLGSVVIDQEYVIFDKSRPASEVIAMYKIAHGKIQEVYFIEPEKD